MSSSLETLSATQLITRKLFLEEQLSYVIEALQKQEKMIDLNIELDVYPQKKHKVKIKNKNRACQNEMQTKKLKIIHI